jgi:hypothetical protein
VCQQKLNRLKQIIKERENWREPLEEVKSMRKWVLDAEAVLDGSWTEQHEPVLSALPCITNEQVPLNGSPCVTNEQVGLRFDHWRAELAKKMTEGTLSQKERDYLEHFLHVLSNARPYLIQCYELKDFPRTNNETEGSIRKLKTRYRRISGRKNWNAYLIKYGRCVAFYDWWCKEPKRWQQFQERARHLNTEQWKEARKTTTTAQSEQLKRFRFRHKREKILPTLEKRWAAAAAFAPCVQTSSLH